MLISPNILIFPCAFLSLIKSTQCLKVLLKFETLQPYNKD